MTGIFNLQLQTGAVTFGCAATAISLGALIAARWQQRSKNKIPTKWRRVGEISELYIYPLKSGKYIKVDVLECTELGVKTTDDNPLKLRDRNFMVFSSENGRVKTARQHANMFFIKVTQADDESVTFEAPDMPTLTVKLPGKEGDGIRKKTCTLWRKETVEVLDCGDEAAKWMSKFLCNSESGARLGYYVHEVLERRNFSNLPYSEFRSFYNTMEVNDAGIYSDLASYHLMTESSVEELHSRVSSSVSALTPLQFRPNFVVRGSKPFDEDNWDWVRIGDVIFRNFKPCTRCFMTTIDPDSAVRHKQMEPLKTLKSYRQVTGPARKVEGEAPRLGVFMASKTTGIVHTGDPIYVGE